MATTANTLPAAMEEREAYIILNMLPDFGPQRTAALEAAFGSLAKAFQAPEDELARVPKIGKKLAGIIRNYHQYCDLKEELRRAEQAGVYILTRMDEGYPLQLLDIHDPPLCLYVCGCMEALRQSKCAIALVGSRFATNYGLTMARKLAAQAADAGWVVVSGLARGVDTAAHQATLDNDGCTIAVLGSGFAYVYPTENAPLARDIANKNGAVISEFQMLQPPDRRHFPMRNRIISGLSRGTVVVEAGLNSGSLITAGQAAEQGRAVFAVPGRADTGHSGGCHALLKDGARLVENFHDVMDEFQLLPGLDDQHRLLAARSRDEEMLEITLGELECQIWEAMGENETTVEILMDKLDKPPSIILGALMTMEIRQLVRQLPFGRVQKIPNRKVKPR